MIEINDLGINLNKRELITIIGAGGKTSIMFDIANKLSKLNKKILITTTTKIYIPDRKDVYIYIGDIKNIPKVKGQIIVAGYKTIKDNKIKGYTKKEINEIYLKNIFDYIIVEGDGANRKSIKAPRENEPVVPQKTSLLIGVVGIDVYGSKICEENVFGLREFLKITNKKENELIDKESIINLITNKKGLFKYKANRNILVLNKVNKANKCIVGEIKKHIEERDSEFVNNVIEIEELQ